VSALALLRNAVRRLAKSLCHFVVRDGWTRVIQSFLNLGTKPGVMRFRVGEQARREGTFIRNARQHDANDIRNSQTHAVESSNE